MNMRVLSVLGAAALVAGSSLPAAAQLKATTEVLPRESFVGTTSLTLPTPPVLPALFTSPITTVVVKDGSITSDTLITDKYGVGSDIKTWGADVTKCLYSPARIVRVAGEKAVPFVINGADGVIKLNANGRAVCSIY
jgi:hypothetical protein